MSDENTCTTGTLLNCCLYFTANTLARIMGRFADECFRGTGLSPSHAFTLMLVNEQPQISQKELSEALHLAPSTMTRFVDKLIDKGLVQRETSGKLARVRPTERGEQLAAPIAESWKALYYKYSDILGEEEGRELTRIIDTANRKLEG